MDPKCKAFRYSKKLGFGYLCNDVDLHPGYHEENYVRDYDWKLCGFSTGGIYCCSMLISQLKITFI